MTSPTLPNEIVYCSDSNHYYEAPSWEELVEKVATAFIDRGYPAFMEVGVLVDDGQMPFAQSVLKQFNEELRLAHLDMLRELSYGWAR